MARIDALPSLEIIRGLKGILDFYLWKGLPCVRAWPRYRPAKQTPASLAAALVFGAIVKSYGLLGAVPLEAYREDALDQTRTARDIMVTGVYGNLHEASMSDFLDLLTQSRDFLSQLTALLNALHSIDTDEIVVNVDESVLPTGASTAAAQALALAQLQNIGDLQDALQSKGLDRLLVRGQDQLFSYDDNYHERVERLSVAAGDHTLTATPVPAGKVRLVTNVAAGDTETAITRIDMQANCAAAIHILKNDTTPAIFQFLDWQGWVMLEQDDFIQAIFTGCALNDNLYLQLLGFNMTKET